MYVLAREAVKNRLQADIEVLLLLELQITNRKTNEFLVFPCTSHEKSERSSEQILFPLLLEKQNYHEGPKQIQNSLYSSQQPYCSAYRKNSRFVSIAFIFSISTLVYHSLFHYSGNCSTHSCFVFTP